MSKTHKKAKQSLTSLVITSPTPSSTIISPSVQVLPSPGGKSKLKDLIVPTPLLTNNTPTPVRTMLKDFVDGNGVLLDTLQQDMKASPFDVDFRRAVEAKGSKYESTSSSKKDEDVLNTPQVLSLLDQVQMSQQSSQREGSSKANRPIAPAPSHSKGNAKLMIKLPTGQAIHLSEMPIVQDITEDITGKSKPKQSRKRANQPSKEPTELEKLQQLKESNKEAARRFRERKKKRFEEQEREIEVLRASNKDLNTENRELRKEVSKLKNMLELHLECDVTKQRNEKSLISEKLRPKLVTYTSDIVPVVKVIKEAAGEIQASAVINRDIQSGGTVNVVKKRELLRK